MNLNNKDMLPMILLKGVIKVVLVVPFMKKEHIASSECQTIRVGYSCGNAGNVYMFLN